MNTEQRAKRIAAIKEYFNNSALIKWVTLTESVVKIEEQTYSLYFSEDDEIIEVVEIL
jgi:hypothetical protein